MAKKRDGFFILFLGGLGLLALSGKSGSGPRPRPRPRRADDGPPTEEPLDPVTSDVPSDTETNTVRDTELPAGSGDVGSGPTTEFEPVHTWTVRGDRNANANAYARSRYPILLAEWRGRLDMMGVPASVREVYAERLALWSTALWGLETGWGRNEYNGNGGNIAALGAHQSLWNGEFMWLRVSPEKRVRFRAYPPTARDPSEVLGARDFCRLIASRYDTETARRALVENDFTAWYRDIVQHGYSSFRDATHPTRPTLQSLVDVFNSSVWRVTNAVHIDAGTSP